jgi:tryptophan-rich sensory protein
MIEPWMIIGGVTFLIALAGAIVRPKDVSWGKRLDRPKWLFFEPAIPFIWTFIFICGALSAILIWEQEPGSFKTWLLMGLYLLVEIVTVAYIPVTLWMRSLAVGTLLGGSGFVLAVLLAIAIWPISQQATLLLVPYLLWTPVGTYTTREMIDLNPEAV